MNPRPARFSIPRPGVINALAVLWAGVIVYLAFSNLQLACVGFFSFTLSYLVGKYT